MSPNEDLKAQLVEVLRQAPSGLSNEQLEAHFGGGKMSKIAEVQFIARTKEVKFISDS